MSLAENWPLVATYHPAYIPHGSRLAAKFVKFRKKISTGDSGMRLRLIKYTLHDRPYTAFVAMTDRQFSDLIAVESDNVDLSPYESQIIRVVETHQPSDVELAGVREAFWRFYTDAKGPAK